MTSLREYPDSPGRDLEPGWDLGLPPGYSGNVDGVYRVAFKVVPPISEGRLTVYLNRRPFFAVLFVRAC